MALDPSAKEINFKDSVRKFFYEQLAKPPTLIPLSFDSGEAVPSGAASSEEDEAWVVINFNGFIEGPLMEAQIVASIAGRSDLDADNVTIIRDIIREALTSDEYDDEMARIPFYNELNVEGGTPTVITNMLAEVVFESPLLKAVDGTKYKTLTISFSWGAKI